mgnify:CR=1 FL=1
MLFDKKDHTILVADDSPMMRMAVKSFLQNEGYQVVEASDGEAALGIFSQCCPDIVLLDYIMPGINGIETCRLLQNVQGESKVPIIMITSMEHDDVINASFAAGVTDYITKPINWVVLRQRLKRLLAARDSEQSLKRSEAFSRSIIEHAAIGILTVEADGFIKFANPAVTSIFGYTTAELDNEKVSCLIPNISLAGQEEHDYKNDLTGYRKNGTSFPVECIISPFGSDGRRFITIMMRDVTERQQYEEIIRRMAFFDSVTGLANRMMLKEQLKQEIAKAKRNNTKLAVLYIDLDGFKQINDTLGHDSGDKVLWEIGQRMKSALQSSDTVARLGGDEFSILLPDLLSEEQLGNICTKVLVAIMEPIRISGHELVFTGSIGIARYPDDSTELEELLVYADLAMYDAKQKGKNNFKLFTQKLNTEIKKRLKQENDLRSAIAGEEFVIHYQPKIDGLTERITGMEALVRWQHPNSGLLLPATFISLAEETGMIIPIGEWVLRTACVHNKALLTAGFPPIRVAVNVSARQFELQDFSSVVASALRDTGMAAQYLELEITESVAMYDVPQISNQIKMIKELGVQISIDDFGLGYSSLSKLHSIAVDKLKIDKSFVQCTEGSTDSCIIAATILMMGKSLSLGVVAEGVENAEQARFLRDKGCEEMQGYYFARPMPYEEFVKFYQVRRDQRVR